MSNETIRLQIARQLKERQKQIEKQLESIQNNDPVMADGPNEIAETGTEAWQADVHAQMVVLKNNLQDLSTKIKESLHKINQGTYGCCEKCGNQIELERLQIMPTAVLCAVCITLGFKTA